MDGWLKTIILLGIFFLVSGTLGITSGENIDEIDWSNITADAMEANPDLLNSTFSDIPQIPPMPIEATGDAMIEGTGNVSDIIEIENAQGDVSETRLLINGTDDTKWGYQKLTIDEENYLYSGAMVYVENATVFDLEGYSQTPEHIQSFSGIRHFDDSPDALFSASAIVLTMVEDNQTFGWGLTNQLTGSVDILNRAYQVQIPPMSDSLENQYDPFELEWDLQPKITSDVQSDALRQEEYSAAYMSMDEANINQRLGYAYSTPYGSSAIQNSRIQSGSGVMYLLSDTLLWDYGGTYNAAYEYMEGDHMLNTEYSGTTSSLNNTSQLSAYFNGNSNATILERKFSLEEKESPNYEFAETVSDISAKKGQTITPASLSGKSQIVSEANKNIILSQYGANGGIVRRGDPDANCFAFAGDNLVEGNITAGSEATSEISSITGQETLAIDGTRANTTRIAGAWTISTPEKIPYIRWASGSNGVKDAYLNEGQTSPLKVVKESVKADKTGVYIT